MRNELIKIASAIGDRDDFTIVSHTIDPENDTEAVLKTYFEDAGITSKQWQLVRTTLDKTYDQAFMYMTAFKPNMDGSDFFLHSSYVTLVDKDQNIRGFYDILMADDIIRLKKDIQILLD